MITGLDLAIIAVYLALSIAAGLWFRGRQETTGDYFTASGGLGGLLGSILVGLSIAATLFSGISFLSYPSVIFSDGIVLFMGVALICMPMAWLVLLWFLPRYLAHPVQQPYDLIEARFGGAARTVAAAMYVLMRIGWMAAMIYAPTLALMAAARLDPSWFWPIVLITGLSSTFYTVMGGIRGVIITDAIQFCVIMLGIAMTIGYVVLHLPVPMTEAWQTLEESGRLHWLNFSLDPQAPLTFWTVAIGVTVANIANYVGDPMSLQRYLACGSVAAAKRSFIINVVGVLIVLTLLMGVGLSTFTWYHYVPDPHLPTNADKVFPHFIATELPTGISGLLLAALLAATMSSMTSGINALAGTITLDFRTRLGPAMSPPQAMRFARRTSWLVGLASTLAAGFVDRLGTIFQLTQIILGVFAGPLLVAVLLAVTQARIRGAALVAGLITGGLLGMLAAYSPHIAALWVAPIAATGTAAVTFLINPFLSRAPSTQTGDATAPEAPLEPKNIG